MAIINNPRTTITAVVGAATYLLAAYGLDVPDDVKLGIVAIAVFVIGIIGADGKEED